MKLEPSPERDNILIQTNFTPDLFQFWADLFPNLTQLYLDRAMIHFCRVGFDLAEYWPQLISLAVDNKHPYFGDTYHHQVFCAIRNLHSLQHLYVVNSYKEERV